VDPLIDSPGPEIPIPLFRTIGDIAAVLEVGMNLEVVPPAPNLEAVPGPSAQGIWLVSGENNGKVTT